ncbi:FixH family protein [Microbulbifer bruguierae]|uniref:FixH family protein n=1 Tax=Microbulbifer bruguierae TaxID=3029061 RepID=A0ABY8NCW2_9GAMM|nr:FixH family protein [Microbulbifer bruguierae]WGL16633.1 FixH family protein [Microbulbifer bruguierae]
MQQNSSKQGGSAPWYREPWFWAVMAPLFVVVIVSAVMVSIAVRHSDDVVSDTYYKDSRMYHYSADQDQRAKAMNLAAMLLFSPEDNTVSLDLRGDIQFPQKLLLTLSHPVEADLDEHVVLQEISTGRYRGEIHAKLQHRWYLQLMPELDPDRFQDAQWRLKGEINFNIGNGVPLNPVEQ